MPASASRRPRGRPRIYNPDTALKAMRRIFWAKGFAATTLDDITAATGMNRPSLYNAFGDKTEAFRAVLEHYVNEVRPLYRDAFYADLPLRDSLMRVYEAAISIYDSEEAQGMGCFMIGAALTDVKRDPKVGEMILSALKEIELGFVRRLERAQAAGELAADSDIPALARVASSGHNTISVRMRAGESVDDIRQYLRQVVDIILR